LRNDQIPNNGYVSQLSGEATYVFDGALVNGTASGQIPTKFEVGNKRKNLMLVRPKIIQ
jgi:hypothetical protein